jgi:hypothetical protein
MMGGEKKEFEIRIPQTNERAGQMGWNLEPTVRV